MDNTETEKWESISQVPYYCESKDENNTDIHCYGSLLVDIPSNLNEFLVKLSVTDANIIYIKRNSMERYRNSIRDIYISHAPELKFLHGFLRGVTSSTFYSLCFRYLFRLAVFEVPGASYFEEFLHTAAKVPISYQNKLVLWFLLTRTTKGNTVCCVEEFSHTGMAEMQRRYFPPQAHPGPDLWLWPGSNYLEDLLGDVPLATVRPFEGCGCNMMVLHLTMPFRTLNFNDITCIDDNAFNGSQIAELYIRSNIRLGELGQNAFKGLKSLRMLDLSETAIKGLPVEGLRELEILKIEKTHTMQTIPSIYDLRNLKEAKLTHSFHCCAFRYPEHHNPEKHAQYEENMKNICKELGQSRGQFIIKSRKKTLHSFQRGYIFHKPRRIVAAAVSAEPYNADGETCHPRMMFTLKPTTSKLIDPTEKIINLSEVHPLIAAGYENSDKSFLIPLRGKTIEQFKETPNDFIAEDDGFFHPHPVKINESQLDAICGKIVFKIPEVDCSPEPNALNPCEDIMGSTWLRMSVWCVLTLALLGNLSVIIVVIFGESDINVSRFLICNLAFADFCMGLYLLLIASMDYHSVGEYFNYAYNWQYGKWLGCQIAGFLTVFSTHLSVFTLAVVTLERWFTITYAIYLTKENNPEIGYKDFSWRLDLFCFGSNVACIGY
ncbi:hypothetical protein NQ317_000141 [Molorchus minor]|uniref:G-protein coupled receptors family 1 profile domain-containing protein n=1 Tax=Molorchus minor TaxID=1323400 RepID=A0ABQ9JFL8_9CUCU|nr:hypothetical protein NQ317_000141 [Molorchus minor]